MKNELSLGPEFIWKNFHLGTELEIAGNFLYDGLYTFDQMNHFYFETEIFNCLYHLSVGIERLQKITLILLTDFKGAVNLEFEKSLISHSTQHFHQRISQLEKISLGKYENKLLTILTNFYNKNRYGRFNFKSSDSAYHEKNDFIQFLNDLMKGEEIKADFNDITQNNNYIKAEFGQIIKGITISYYKIIENICREKNIYTYEMNQESKAFQVLVCENFDFINSNHVKREILYYFMKNGAKFLEDIQMEDIDFDEDERSQLIKYVLNQCKNTYYIDSYKCIIDDQFCESKNLENLIKDREVFLDQLFNL